MEASEDKQQWFSYSRKCLYNLQSPFSATYDTDTDPTTEKKMPETVYNHSLSSEIRGSHSGVAEVSVLPVCEAVFVK